MLQFDIIVTPLLVLIDWLPDLLAGSFEEGLVFGGSLCPAMTPLACRGPTSDDFYSEPPRRRAISPNVRVSLILVSGGYARQFE